MILGIHLHSSVLFHCMSHKKPTQPLFVTIKENKYTPFFFGSIVYIRVWKTLPRLLYLDEPCEDICIEKMLMLHSPDRLGIHMHNFSSLSLLLSSLKDFRDRFAIVYAHNAIIQCNYLTQL